MRVRLPLGVQKQIVQDTGAWPVLHKESWAGLLIWFKLTGPSPYIPMAEEEVLKTFQCRFDPDWGYL